VIKMNLFDSPRKFTASDARKTFNLKTEYSKWNRMLFGGELPDIPLKWVRSKRVGGYVQVMVNRMTGESTAKVLAISDFLTLDENRFNQIMIHEMIHVWQAQYNIRESKGNHGRQFITKARELGPKVGLKIPLTEDISDLEASDAVQSKDFIVVLISGAKDKDGHMIFTESNWNSKKAKFEADLKKLSSMYGIKFEVVKSNDRGLLKATVKKQVMGRGGRVSWSVSKPGFHDTMKSGGEKMEEIKEKVWDDSKAKKFLLGLGGFLDRALEKRFADSTFTTQMKSTTDKGHEVVMVLIKSTTGPGIIVISAAFKGGETSDVSSFFIDDLGRQIGIYQSRDKYPTPQTLLKALDTDWSTERLERAFGAKSV